MLTYKEKLDYLRSTFIKYYFQLLEDCKNIAHDAPLIVRNTDIQRKISFAENIPGIGWLASILSKVIGSQYYISKAEAIKIHNIFSSISEEKIKNILSEGILNAAVTFESLIENFKTHEIGTLADEAANRLLAHFKAKDILTISDEIVKIKILESWKHYTIPDTFHKEHSNYYRVSASDIERCINDKIHSNYLREYFITSHDLDPNSQLIVSKEAREIAHEALDLSYLNLNDPIVINNGFFNVKSSLKIFAGRKHEIENIHNYFTKHQDTHIIQIIYGLAGVGKTETALYYISKFQKEYVDKKYGNINIIWINAENEETLNESFRELAIGLKLLDIDKKNSEEILLAVKDKLSKMEEKILIVFDGAESQKHLKNYLPNDISKTKHHIIITTENRDGWNNINNYIRLSEFSESEAIDYIQKSIPELIGDPKALAELYHNFPLGLAQSVRYITESASRKNNIEQYIMDYKQAKDIGGEHYRKLLESDGRYKADFYFTISMTIKKLSPNKQRTENENKIFSAIQDVLKIWRCLNLREIPEEIFKSKFPNPIEFNQIFKTLGSIILYNKNTIYMNKMMQEAVKGEIPFDPTYLKEALTLINNKILDTSLGYNEQDILDNNRFLEQQELLSEIMMEERDLEVQVGIAKLYIACGNLYFLKDEFNRAKKYYEAAEFSILKITQDAAGAQQTETDDDFKNPLQVDLIDKLLIAVFFGKGNIYERKSMHDNALSEYNEALQLQKRIYGENSVQAARVIYSIGCINCKFNHENALKHFEQALSIVTGNKITKSILNLPHLPSEQEIKELLSSMPGPNKILFAKIIDAIGTAHKVHKHFKDNFMKYDFSLKTEIFLGRYGLPTKPHELLDKYDLLKVFERLLERYELKIQYDKALRYYELALQINNIIYEGQAHHPQIVINLLNIGNAKLVIGKHKDAENDFKTLLAPHIDSTQDTAQLAMILRCYGEICLHTNRNNDALIKLQESKEMLDRLQKSKKEIEHLPVSTDSKQYSEQYLNYESMTFFSIAQTYLKLSQYSEAEENFIKSWEIKKTIISQSSGQDYKKIWDKFLTSSESNKNAWKTIKANLFDREDSNQVLKNIFSSVDHQNALTIYSEITRLEHYKLVILAFTIKELMDSAPMINYFSSEIFQMQNVIDLPSSIDEHAAWIAIYFGVSAIGVSLIKTEYITKNKWKAAIPTSLTYSIKLLSSHALSKHQSDYDNGTINSISEFVYECYVDIGRQLGFSAVNYFFGRATMHIIATPLMIDAGIMTILEGARCYTSHQSNNQDKSYGIGPYIADSIVGILALSQINILHLVSNFNNNKLATSMITIKSMLIVMHAIMLTDYTCKIFIDLTEENHWGTSNFTEEEDLKFSGNCTLEESSI